MDAPPPTDHTKRDSDTFLLIGGFIVLLAVPVLIGTLWTARAHAAIVNVAAGIALLLIGGGMFIRGLQLRKLVK